MSKTTKNEQFWTKNKQKSIKNKQKSSKNSKKTPIFDPKIIKKWPFFCVFLPSSDTLSEAPQNHPGTPPLQGGPPDPPRILARQVNLVLEFPT